MMTVANVDILTSNISKRFIMA